MSHHLKAEPAGDKPTGAGWAGRGQGIKGDATSDYSRDSSILSIPHHRRLDPKAGALIKLDVCEHRLRIANTTGDNDTWVRFYQSWLCLHSLAFSYGKWAKGASDGN